MRTDAVLRQVRQGKEEQKMANINTIAPIQPITASAASAAASAAAGSSEPSMFSQLFESMIDNVKETDAAKNEKYYALVTGQLDNPAEATIAAAQALTATQLLVQMRNRALDAYSELMRISM